MRSIAAGVPALGYKNLGKDRVPGTRRTLNSCLHSSLPGPPNRPRPCTRLHSLGGRTAGAKRKP